MGNWRTVNIIGTCDSGHVAALRNELTYDYRDDNCRFHALSNTGGISGLGEWVGESINASGNLAGRDYGVEGVADCLGVLVGIAPSLTLKVHCGDDYESKTCIATITVEGGKVTTGPPEIETLQEQDEEVMRANFMQQMMRQNY